MGTYKPNIECRGDFPSRDSCINILTEMPASAETRVFGPEADPSTQVSVPHVIEACKLSNYVWNITFADTRPCEDDEKCFVRMFYVEKKSDTASWYSIWQAVSALWAVCIRNYQRGSFRGLG